MKSFNEVWELAREYCKEKMSEVAFNVWIDVLTPVKFENGTAYLSVRSTFQKISLRKSIFLSLPMDWRVFLVFLFR